MAAISGANAVVCKPSTTPSCTSGSKGVVCMKWESPTSCSSSSPTSGNYETTWTVSGCTGGSGVTSFGGEIRCSETNGTYATQGNPSSTSGTYCWCRLTSPAASAWVFQNVYGSADSCSRFCAHNCAADAQDYSDFRSARFSALGA
jgi:hypothetical protein